MKKAKAAVAAGLAGAAMATVGLTGPAEAAKAAEFVPGFLNLYSDYNQQGNSQYFWDGFTDLTYLPYHGAAMSMNDTISSYSNDTDYCYYFFVHPNHGGHVGRIYPRSSGNFGPDLSEQISSFYRSSIPSTPGTGRCSGDG